MKRLLTIVLVLILLLAMVPTTSVLAATNVIDVRVERDADDCVRFVGGRFSDEVSYVSVGSSNASDFKHGSGMRFNDVDVPHGATIVEAYITITARSSDSSDDVVSYISAERNSNPSSFSGDNAATFDKRWKNNTVEVKWNNIESWSKGEEYESPNIKRVVQEVVDRSDWEGGNSIVIFWEDFDGESHEDAYRVGYSHDSSSGKAAELRVEYTYADGNGGGDYEDVVEELESQISTLNAQLVEMTVLTSRLRSSVDNFSNESRLLRDEYASMRNELGADMSALHIEVANLKNIVVDLESERSSASIERLDKLNGKLSVIVWLVALPLVVVVLVVGYFVLRRQR